MTNDAYNFWAVHAGAVGSALALRFPTKLHRGGAGLQYFGSSAVFLATRARFVEKIHEIHTRRENGV